MAHAHSDDISRFVTFKLAENKAGINILEIREIVPSPKISPVPQAPEFVMGLINLRGCILTVIDIGLLLGLGRTEPGPQSHILIFKYRDIGFMVDKIGDLIGSDTAQADNIPANVEPGVKKFMAQVINLPKDILMVLSSRKILSEILPAVEEPGDAL